MKKNHKWSCIAAAFAHVAGVTEQRFCEIIGHDGGDILFPGLKEPSRRRGHHIQECISALDELGFSCTPIEYMPVIKSPKGQQNVLVSFGNNLKRFDDQLLISKGVMQCRGRGTHHAVANLFGQIHDPDLGDTPGQSHLNL